MARALTAFSLLVLFYFTVAAALPVLRTPSNSEAKLLSSVDENALKRVVRHNGVTHSMENNNGTQNATDSSTPNCPVCGMAVNVTGTDGFYVSVKNATQKVYTCSEEHGKMVLSAPMKYVVSAATPVGNMTGAMNGSMSSSGGHGNMSSTTTTTVVTPERECPFCKMDGVKQHAIHFKYGQALYACSMPPHNQKIQNETALMGAFSALVSTAPTSSNGGSNSSTPTQSAGAGSQTGTKPSSGVRVAPGLLLACSLAAALLL